MASAAQSDYEEDSISGSEISVSGSDIDSDSDRSSDVGSASQVEPCRYYNRGSCKNGKRCAYMHVCKYALKGNCRYGSNCNLNHQVGGRASSGSGSRSANPKLTDGRYFQWQLNNGNGWQDVENDHVIEAQYSLPHTKSIKIYNTQYGAVSIDFKRMKVYGKDLRVRRLDDGSTTWLWYCMLRRKWINYGAKDSKGNSTPVKSSDIEKKFQSDPTSSFTFTIGSETFRIKFKEMQQVSQKRKRKVTRRPQYRHQAGPQVVQGLQNLTLSSKPQWQFEGRGGKWHTFKHRTGTSTECSVTSDDIERQYQQNRSGSMSFTVNGQSYKLDFRAMTQVNLKNTQSRKIRRVLV
ncbi:uncharacterized protein si:ch211-244b2.4 [Mugil cephalus]|uniref:uncharacterized protein si:ch211-244b2.4 n=1 Tax=Mugil cephalus TaxID=48193 RepID=UPI001FB770FE|nr:uncharacterized protein si:ch211-244b2.4 [Mugil cephalus]